MKLLLRLDDMGEYDIRQKAWRIYKLLYKNNIIFSDSDIIRDDGRPYVICEFKNKKRITSQLKFSGETDFNFSKNKKRELCRSRFDHYKKILETDLEGKPILDTALGMLNECFKMYHSKENISIMPQTGNLQGVKGSVALDRIDVWLLVLNMKYKYNVNLLQNHSTVENHSAVEEFLNLFEDVYDYANVIYHIDKELVDDLIVSGKRPLSSATDVINYMFLAKRFWNQKNEFIVSQLIK